MRISEILTAAKAEIEKGWGQGVMYQHPSGRIAESADPTALVCSLGAIQRVTRNVGSYQLFDTATCFLAKAISPKKESPTVKIAHWNDRPRTTKKDVLKKFDQAITAAKECEDGNES